MMSINLSDIAVLNDKVSDYAVLLAEWDHNLNEKYWFDWKKWNIIKHKSLLSHIKMGKEILMFGNVEIDIKLDLLNNIKFYRYKSPIF